MALLKPTQFKGIDINAYYKINSLIIQEWGKDEEWKLYTLKVEVTSYTTPEKRYDIEWVTYEFPWIREAWLNIANAYALIKTTPQLAEATDA